jgi:putative transposase
VSTDLYKRHRFPVEIISHCVWLYHRFDMSFRAVEELLFERGVVLSYETVRRWCLKFGPEFARRLKRRRAQPGDKWHLDEVFLNIGGERRYLWRAVDQAGNTLDILVTSKRDKRAAKRFLRKLLRDNTKPRVVVTDKLRSYGAALRELLPHTEHRQSRYLNNRAENSHQRTRRREQVLQRFKSSGHAQRFLSVFEPLNTHFRPPRHLLKAPDYRQIMSKRFSTWREVTELAATA